MSRLLVFTLFGVLFINISCERCKTCRYSYTETVIVETPDGEEEQKIEHENLILINEDGSENAQECIKRSEYKSYDDPNEAFTIENDYLIEQETTDLDNFLFECVDS
ncbi:MAG: hypothetical protein GQ574_16950 [Crocinitomix sp.]|nr:hypothetical protein [Crocinitomix sp.]